MEKNIFEFDGATKTEADSEAERVSGLMQLSELHLAMVGGGIGDTVL